MLQPLPKLTEELDKLLNSANPLFVGFGTDPVTTATKWADVLFAYWAGAQSSVTQCPVEPNSFMLKKGTILCEPGTFVQMLSLGIGPVGLPITFATAFDNAFRMVWLGQLFVPILPVTIAVATPLLPVAMLLANALVPVLTDFATPASAKAAQLANVFDTATRTVSVTTTIPLSTPVIEPLL